MTRFQQFWQKVIDFIEFLKPYVRVTRMFVTMIAPMILMIMYLCHRSMRTKKIWRFIRNFKSDRAIISSSMRSQTQGIMELTQLNDMFWVRLT